MLRFSAPFAALATLAVVLAGCGQAAGAGATTPPTTTSATPPAVARPTFQLTIAGGTAAGSYTADPKASLATCSTSATGVRSLLYAGGDPWVSIDLVMGAAIAEPGHASDVAIEFQVGSDYLWIDTGGLRGGDAPGRSTATVRVEPAAGSVRYTIDATTPYRTPDGDGPSAAIALTVTCPV
jgi:hypothetical protein